MAKKNPLVLQLGQAIRARRLAIALSQDDFADRIHMHRAYYSAIERGEKTDARGGSIAHPLYVPWRGNAAKRSVKSPWNPSISAWAKNAPASFRTRWHGTLRAGGRIADR